MSEIEITNDLLDEIDAKAKAADKVAPGPWEVSSEKQDDAPYRHLEFALLDANGNRFAGTENSDTTWGLLEEDSPDEYGFSAMWNEPARIVTEFIRVAGPANSSALTAEIRRLRAENEGTTAIAKLLADNVLAVAEARRAALEEAAIEFDRAWHEKQSITYACACVRSLKDKEPAR